MTMHTETMHTETMPPQTSPTQTTPQSTLGDEAGHVADTAKQEFSSLLDQARGEWQQQLSEKGHQAAGGLRRMSEQLGSLAAGRPEEAQRLQQFANDARERLQTWSSRLDERGMEGVVADVRDFARRRPGMFLLGAVGAGFVVARIAKMGGNATSGTTTAQSPAWSAPGTNGMRQATDDRLAATPGNPW